MVCPLCQFMICSQMHPPAHTTDSHSNWVYGYSCTLMYYREPGHGNWTLKVKVSRRQSCSIHAMASTPLRVQLIFRRPASTSDAHALSPHQTLRDQTRPPLPGKLIEIDQRPFSSHLLSSALDGMLPLGRLYANTARKTYFGKRCFMIAICEADRVLFWFVSCQDVPMTAIAAF